MQQHYRLRVLEEAEAARKNTILVTTLDGKPWRIEPGGPDYLCGSCESVVIDGVPRNAALISGGVLAVVCTKCGANNRVPAIPSQAD